MRASHAYGSSGATETARLVLDYAFTILGLFNVMLHVYGYNQAALRTYLKAGFREFGRRTQSRVFAGQRWDEEYMECLASGFSSPVLGRVWIPDEPRPSSHAPQLYHQPATESGPLSAQCHLGSRAMSLPQAVIQHDMLTARWVKLILDALG